LATVRWRRLAAGQIPLSGCRQHSSRPCLALSMTQVERLACEGEGEGWIVGRRGGKARSLAG